jgi:hypothetical protein
MKKWIILIGIFLSGCLPYRDINENEVDFALSTLGMSAKYVEDEISNGTIEIDVGVAILTDILVARVCLLETRKKMAKIMVNQLAHVKIQGAAGEYKYTLVEADHTTDIRRILDDNGYNDFKIISWKLITVDGLLIEEK